MGRALVAIALLAMAACAAALCPSNGSPRVLYATTNGQRGFHDILMLDSAGRAVGTAINWTSVPKAVRLSKLRCMGEAPDGSLFVASAEGAMSRVAVFSHKVNADCTRNYVGSFASLSEDNPAMQHPYAFVFTHGRDPMLYVSNQNTASVTRYHLGIYGVTQAERAHLSAHEVKRLVAVAGSPVAVPEAVRGAAKHIAPGLFMRHKTPTYTVASVRGIALTPDETKLIVCDVDAHLLRVFDVRTGRALWTQLAPSPIQVHPQAAAFLQAPEVFATATSDQSPSVASLWDTVTGHRGQSTTAHRGPPVPYLLVTSKSKAVGMAPLLPGAPVQRFTRGHKFKATSGVARNDRGGFYYVADRVGRRIFVVRFDGLVLDKFGPALADPPEHLLWTRLERRDPLPRCHEMSGDGVKLSMLCVAAGYWAALALCLAVLFLVFGVRYLVRRPPPVPAEVKAVGNAA